MYVYLYECIQIQNKVIRFIRNVSMNSLDYIKNSPLACKRFSPLKLIRNETNNCI